MVELVAAVLAAAAAVLAFDAWFLARPCSTPSQLYSFMHVAVLPSTHVLGQLRAMHCSEPAHHGSTALLPLQAC
jgi:hypothetical protein